ncbi:hypothetical protein [Thermomonospora amylolytica]|uniref:hypothetical protein n=1 Tax=Thermomonospora amylolytica TaxID=1411117 RepID=UPI001300A461|nr:hypothetical protein [Thermomonospora amylolytica]
MRHRMTAAAVLPILAAVAGCTSPEQSALRQIQPNATVYIDGWDQDGDEGDRALIERKPSGMWVVPVNAPFRANRVGGFTVRVTLDPKRGFVVTDLGGTQVGRDHDDCLEEGETYAFLDVPANALSWEPDAGSSGTPNDDCQVLPVD